MYCDSTPLVAGISLSEANMSNKTRMTFRETGNAAKSTSSRTRVSSDRRSNLRSEEPAVEVLARFEPLDGVGATFKDVRMPDKKVTKVSSSMAQERRHSREAKAIRCYALC